MIKNNEPFYPVRHISDFKDLIAQSAQMFGSNPAFRLKAKDQSYYTVSYALFKHEIDALGTALLSLGLRGSHVALMGKNSYAWCTAYLAITCGTGVVVPIDKELPVCDIANILNVSESKAFIMDQKIYDKYPELRELVDHDIKIILIDSEEDGEEFMSYSRLMDRGYKLLETGNKEYLNARVDEEALGVLIFTSGTTGLSKGVMLSHKNICSDIMAVTSVVKVYETDQTLSILPIHHTYECSLGFLMVIYNGACISFCEGLRQILQNMNEVQPTVFVSVPAMLEKMHERILKNVSQKRGGKIKLAMGKAITASAGAMGIDNRDKVFKELRDAFGGKIRLIITGAAAIKPEVVRDFNSFGFTVLQGYGLTECSPLVIGNNDRLSSEHSIGIPIPGVEVRIANPDANGIGELMVKGPNVMMGYYKDPESTSAVMDGEWLHTGDLGRVNENGMYSLTGRIKNVIVTKNGKNIYPEEVEFYLNNNPLVYESIVVGEDDADETLVKAKIFPNMEAIIEKIKVQTPSAEDIRNALSDVIKEVNKKLPKYKWIKRFDIRETEFIKTTTQKIKRYIHQD